jgi:tetratricopeptide (TPR) repeat protein
MSLGLVLEEVGKFLEALSVLKQSLDLYTELGHHNYITETHHFLGSVALHRGRYYEARDHARTSLHLAREQGPPYCIGLNLLLLGCLALVEGAHAQAYQLLQEGADVFQEIEGHRDDRSWAQAVLALAAHGLGETPRARQHLSHALEIAQESGIVLPLLWALPVTALLLADEGENERAVELYALASRFPLVARSRWFTNVAGNTLADVAAALPVKQVAVLQECGRARDLQATIKDLLSELRA